MGYIIIDLVVTNKHGNPYNKNFVYTEFKESKNENEIDYYNLCDICNFEETKTISSYKCPQNILSKINQFSKKVGKLKYCIYGRHGIIAFINFNKKKNYSKIYWKYNSYLWKKYNVIFDVKEIKNDKTI